MKKSEMKALLCTFAATAALTLAGCGAESEKDVVLEKEPIPTTEATQAQTQEASQSETPAQAAAITQEQALEAVKNYCFANNPELEGMADSEDVTVYFDVSTNEEGEIVVLYRSYTAAQIRYYVNPTSGEVYVTELVPGIIDEEQRTEETFNIRDYMGQSAEASGNSGAENGSTVKRADGERFEDVIMLEGMDETVKYEHAINDGVGIEIDFDYESLARKSESDKETFISIYDDANKPENYLELTYVAESADAVVASISDELSKTYELSTGSFELENGGSCTTIDASADIGGKTMPDQLQKAYIIPAGEGTVVGRAHYSIESSEGVGHLFAYMMDTIIINK